MASKPVTERLCEQCGKDNKQTKARMVCFECHTSLCVPCSNNTKDHLFIELDPSISKQTSTSFNIDDTVLYRRARVAVESTSVTSKAEKRTTSKQSDTTQLKCTRCLEFSVYSPNDKMDVNVTGVLCVSDNIVVVDNGNKALKLFNQNGTYLSYTELKNSTWGITYVRDSTFATCGLGNTVYLWTVRRQGIFRRGLTIVGEDVSYYVDHNANDIHYNGTYYCVLHSDDDAITILDRQGKQVRKIITKKACGWGIHMDSDTNNIYVTCWGEEGVSCMTIEGKALWFATLSGLPCGITEIQGTLCVADCRNHCLHLITKEGEYVRKLMDMMDLGWMQPGYICYGQDGKLYVRYYKRHMVSVFSVS